jgi:hypothetical protein
MTVHLTNDGSINGSTSGVVLNNSNDDVVINNGVISGSEFGIFTGGGNDLIVLGDGSLTNGGIDAYYGDDTVKLGSGGVQYSMVCGDIKTVTVAQLSAEVNGTINGGDNHDTLIIGQYVEGDGYSVAGTGSFEINGHTYNIANFETVVFAGSYSATATRLYDDGELLAFTSKDGQGIDVCSGPMGFRAATISFASLDENAAGQVFAAGNEGWYVRVFAQGNGQYNVQMYDGNGVLQNNAFTFTHK